MTEYSTNACAELEEDVTRFAYQTELPQEDRDRVEEHLKECPSCGELVFFIQKTRELARKNPIRFEPASEACQDSAAIVALEEGTLDEETSRKLGVHLLHCKRCREAYLLLRSLSEEQFEEKLLERFEAPRWTDVVLRVAARAGQKVIEAGQKMVQNGLEVMSISGSGHIFQPALATVRGDFEVGNIAVEDTVKDEEAAKTSAIRINIEVDQKKATASLQIESDPPQKDWTVSLATPDGSDLMSAPLVAQETMLGSDLADSSYVVTIRRGMKALACFAIDLRAT
jgi:hypothetical protein